MGTRKYLACIVKRYTMEMVSQIYLIEAPFYDGKYDPCNPHYVLARLEELSGIKVYNSKEDLFLDYVMLEEEV